MDKLYMLSITASQELPRDHTLHEKLEKGIQNVTRSEIQFINFELRIELLIIVLRVNDN